MTSLTPRKPRSAREREVSLPERLRLGRTGLDPQHLAPAIRVHADADYHGHRHDAARLACFDEVASIHR